jgi:hypothetical protein
MNIVNRARFVDRKTPGSMGVVKDTRFVNCLWPVLDEPTALFAEGSAGLEVQGPPTPRNVIWPAGTKALGNTNLGVFYSAEDVMEETTKPAMVTEKIMVRGKEQEVTYRDRVTKMERVRKCAPIDPKDLK